MMEAAAKQTRSLKPTSRVAEFICHHIDMLTKSREKTQRDIAFELGYSNPNMVTMLKKGLTKLPINKVEVMATAIHVDPTYLLKLLLSEYMPDSFETINKILNFEKVLTDQERELLNAVRASSGGYYQIKTPEQKAAYENFIKSLEASDQERIVTEM